MMIRLTQYRWALIDAADWEAVSKFKWVLFTDPTSGKLYAYRTIKHRSGKRTALLLHRFLMNAKPGQMVDHRNGDGLDNRRQNLRFATYTQNQANRGPQKRNKLGVKGVTAHGNRFRARLMCHGKEHHLGTFDTIAEASCTYEVAAKRYFGEFARAA